jgi:hypothetical protein
LSVRTAKVTQDATLRSSRRRCADTTSFGLQIGRGKIRFPEDHHVFDLLEFAFEYVALPNAYGSHSYWGHSHYGFDQDKGREQFATEVNRVFERQGLAFELTHGEVTRIAPTGLQVALAQTVFRTGDTDLDRLLETW